MRSKNLVKIASIIGFILAEFFMLAVVLAPNKPGVNESRMFIPKSAIPPVEGIAPGAKPPVKAVIIRVCVGAVFFGPFGALVGMGVGLLINGVMQPRREGEIDPEA